MPWKLDSDVVLLEDLTGDLDMFIVGDPIFRFYAYLSLKLNPSTRDYIYHLDSLYYLALGLLSSEWRRVSPLGLGLPLRRTVYTEDKGSDEEEHRAEESANQ